MIDQSCNMITACWKHFPHDITLQFALITEILSSFGTEISHNVVQFVRQLQYKKVKIVFIFLTHGSNLIISKGF